MELMKINFESEKPTVSGRELHEALEVKTAYKDWFPRMCEYGFADGTDYTILLAQKRATNNPKNPWTEITDHQLSINMAKEICMLQRTEKGKQCRQYFIAIEEQWNTPEAVMARGLQIATSQLEIAKRTNFELETKVKELQPKASYCDVVLNTPDLISTTVIAKDYGKSAVWLNDYLKLKGIQYKRGATWVLYQKHADKGYTNTKTTVYSDAEGTQHSKVHTYWTAKGREFIYNLLKADGIVPKLSQKEIISQLMDSSDTSRSGRLIDALIDEPMQNKKNWETEIVEKINSFCFTSGKSYPHFMKQAYGAFQKQTRCNLDTRVTKYCKATGRPQSKVTKIEVIAKDEKLKKQFDVFISKYIS